jgi:hypothetical protein
MTILMDLVSYHLNKMDGVTPSYGFFSSIDRSYSQISTSRFDSIITGLKQAYKSNIHLNHIYRLELSNTSKIENFDRFIPIEPFPIETITESKDDDNVIWRIFAYVLNVDTIENVTSKIDILFKCLDTNFRDFDYVIHDWQLSNKKFDKRWNKVVHKTRGDIVFELKKMLTEISNTNQSHRLEEFMKKLSQFTESPWTKFVQGLPLTQIFSTKSPSIEQIFKFTTTNRFDAHGLDWRTVSMLCDSHARTLSESFTDEKLAKLSTIVVAFYERVLIDCASHEESIRSILEDLQLEYQDQEFTTFFDLFFSNVLNADGKLIIGNENTLISAVNAKFPLLMDTLTAALDYRSLLYKYLVLILCGIIKLKLINVKSIENFQHLRTVSVVITKIDQFEEREQRLILNCFEPLLYKAQFLLDLCSFVESDDLLRKICIGMRHDRTESLVSMRNQFHSKIFDQNIFVKYLFQILRIDHLALMDIKLSGSHNLYELTLEFNDHEEHYVQISHQEFDAESNGISLIRSVDPNLDTESFICIGSMYFIRRSNIVTLRQSSQLSNRNDPIQHLQNLSSESALLSWKTVTKIKTKRGTTRTITEDTRLFDNDYYTSAQDVVKDTAKYSAIGWIIGLDKRSVDTIAFDSKRLLHLAVGYFSGNDLLPFCMTNDIKRLIGSLKNGRTIFDDTLIANLKKITHSRAIIYSFISILQKNGYISVDKKVPETPIASEIEYPSDVTQVVNKIIRETSTTSNEIADFEKLQVDSNDTLGDPYLLKLIKRKEKLTLELSAKLRENEYRQLLTIPPSTTENKEITVTHHVSIREVISPRVLMDRLLLRLNMWVAISSQEKQGMIHCESIEELAKTLKEQSESEVAQTSKAHL